MISKGFKQDVISLWVYFNEDVHKAIVAVVTRSDQIEVVFSAYQLNSLCFIASHWEFPEIKKQLMLVISQEILGKQQLDDILLTWFSFSASLSFTLVDAPALMKLNRVYHMVKLFWQSIPTPGDISW